jgi:hypothetical protein
MLVLWSGTAALPRAVAAGTRVIAGGRAAISGGIWGDAGEVPGIVALNTGEAAGGQVGVVLVGGQLQRRSGQQTR